MSSFTGVFSASSLKYLGCLFMLMDHVGVLLLPDIIFLRWIGRLSFPLFAFLIANGFRHTSSAPKYLLRLVIFAALAQWPYHFVMGGETLNILFTLSAGLAAIMLMNKAEQRINSNFWAFACNIGICAALSAGAQLAGMDYGWYGVTLICIAWIFFDNFPLLTIGWSLATVVLVCLGFPPYRLLALAALPLLYFYNGQQGKSNRWFFYIFYILHFLLLYLLQQLIF